MRGERGRRGGERGGKSGGEGEGEGGGEGGSGVPLAEGVAHGVELARVHVARRAREDVHLARRLVQTACTG